MSEQNWWNVLLQNLTAVNGGSAELTQSPIFTLSSPASGNIFKGSGSKTVSRAWCLHYCHETSTETSVMSRPKAALFRFSLTNFSLPAR